MQFIAKLFFIFLFFLSAVFVGLSEASDKLKLVFVTSEHCYYCKSWEADIGVIYNDTSYATVAELHRVDFSAVDFEFPHIADKVFGTPTFLIMDNKNEIGRIEGYSSKDLFFWSLSEYVSSE